MDLEKKTDMLEKLNRWVEEPALLKIYPRFKIIGKISLVEIYIEGDGYLYERCSVSDLKNTDRNIHYWFIEDNNGYRRGYRIRPGAIIDIADERIDLYIISNYMIFQSTIKRLDKYPNKKA